MKQYRITTDRFGLDGTDMATLDEIKTCIQNWGEDEELISIHDGDVYWDGSLLAEKVDDN